MANDQSKIKMVKKKKQEWTKSEKNQQTCFSYQVACRKTTDLTFGNLKITRAADM